MSIYAMRLPYTIVMMCFVPLCKIFFRKMQKAINIAVYMWYIEINHLCKSYDGFTLDDIGFCVPKGSIMGFIGQNGVGKSTTIILTLAKPMQKA